jgi:hypothetical protein
VTASRIFYYLERERDGSPFAYLGPDGPTVPIFSSAVLAERALPRAHAVTPVSPTQLEVFAQLCAASGAKFLEVDPQAAAFGGFTTTYLQAN